MSTFDDFLPDHPRVDITVHGGTALCRLDGKMVYTGNYVIGDMEDKLGCACRALKALSAVLLAQGEPEELIHRKLEANPQQQKGPPALLDLDDILGLQPKNKGEQEGAE